MSHLHKREYLEANEQVVVECSHQVNVMLMSDLDYMRFRRGERFETYGGFFTHFPARVPVPNSGNWNVVVALPPGRSATYTARIGFVRNFGR